MTASLRAQLSASALEANAREAFARAGEHAIADLRRDAWGHGLAFVARTLADAGVRAARADDEDRAALIETGLAVTDAAPTLDGDLLFGMPGSGGAPVMRLAADVLSIKRLLAGEGVSYNYTHRATVDTRIALVAGGFGQGVARSLGNHVSVEIAGRRLPIVGRVAMDVCVVDVGDAPVSPGDEVVYFGGTGPARDELTAWEAASGLEGAELACALGLRVPREVTA